MTRIATFLKPVPVASTALAAAATGAWLAWTPVAGADTAGRRNAPSVVDLVAETSPAVVTVLATQEADADEMARAAAPRRSPFGPDSPFDEFFRRFGMPDGQQMPQARSSPRASRAWRSARASWSTRRLHRHQQPRRRSRRRR